MTPEPPTEPTEDSPTPAEVPGRHEPGHPEEEQLGDAWYDLLREQAERPNTPFGASGLWKVQERARANPVSRRNSAIILRNMRRKIPI